MTDVEVRIERAIDELEEAAEVYTGFASVDDPTILDVNASSTDFSRGTMQQEVNDALQKINDANSINNGEYDSEIEELRDIRSFFRYAYEVQTNLVGAYEDLEAARESFNEGAYSEIQDNKTSMRSKAAEAESELEDLKSNSSASSMAHMRTLSPQTYEEKVAQFETEIDSFFELFDGLTDFADGLLAFAISWDDYHDNDDEYIQFNNAKLGDAREVFEEAPKPDSTRSITEAFECSARAYEDAAVYMDGAAAAQRDNDLDTALDYEEQAEKALNQCGD